MLTATRCARRGPAVSRPRPLGRCQANDRGSVVLASSVILVMLMLATVVTVRAVADQRSARLTQDRNAAISSVDLAVAYALARIDRGESATFVDSGRTAAASYQVVATEATEDSWTLRVDSQAGRAHRAVALSLSRAGGSGWQPSGFREITPARYATAVRALPGLAGYWRLDEGSSSTAVDWSGNSLDGTWSGTVTRPIVGALTDDADPAARFVQGSVNVGDNFDFPGTATFSFIFWVRTDAATGGGGRVFDKDAVSPAPDGIAISTTAGGVGVRAERMGGGVSDAVVLAVPAGTWTHVAFTYDGTTLRGYSNGVDSASTSSVVAIAGNALAAHIGRQAQAAAGWSSDSVDDLAIWSRALSASEVAALHSAAT
jgi:hypothetical protein